jgi:hypothetical protein
LYKKQRQSIDAMCAEFPLIFHTGDALEQLLALVDEGTIELADQARRIDVYAQQASPASFKRSTYVALTAKHVACDEFDIVGSLCMQLAKQAGVDVGIVTMRLPDGRSKVRRGKTRTRSQALLVFPLPPHQMKSRLPLAARKS